MMKKLVLLMMLFSLFVMMVVSCSSSDVEKLDTTNEYDETNTEDEDPGFEETEIFDDPSGINVEGWVGRGVNTSSDSFEDSEYRILITVTNEKDTSLKYDRIERTFIAAEGEPLTWSTSSYSLDGKTDDMLLETGDSKSFEIRTGGHTDDLLDNSNDEPILLSISLKLKNETVAGPYEAYLPDFYGEMPQYELLQTGEDVELIPLEFE